MTNLCMGCMNPLPEGSQQCTVCGFPVDKQNPDHCLPTATLLQEHYIVGRVLEQGSDSLLYIGYDRIAKEPCLITEFFPGALCKRDDDSSVKPLSGCESVFADYYERFHGLLKSLARVKDLPAIIPVYDIFEERGSVYGVTDYCEGITLTKKMQQSDGRIPWSEARPMFLALLTCVSQLHSAHIRHLAICPDNILIGRDGKARLRNFSLPEARCAGTDLTPALPAGYAAPEQYELGGEISDSTDVYGLAATMFAAVTGNVPLVANKRAVESDDLFMSAEIAEELSQSVCLALFNGLQVVSEDRTQTVAALHDQLCEEPSLSALRQEARDDQQDPAGPRKSRGPLIVLVAVIAALLLCLAVLVVTWLNHQGEEDSGSAAVLPTLTTTATRTKKEIQYSVPELLGRLYYDIKPEELPGEMTFTIKYKEYNNKPAGTVLSQDPKPGTSVKKGQEIVVVVSCGKDDSLTVPDVSGWKEQHARLYLEALGFRVEVAQLLASNYEKGLVDSTDPVPGTKKMVGDVITLRVSNVEPPPEEPSDEPVDEPYTDDGGDDQTADF